MAGRVTRMLLLGAVALFEPVNGYQIRRELVSWHVDEWAHTNPGSIYHGLTSLTRDGHLVRHDLVDAGREVAVYELTDQGRTALEELLQEAVEAVDVHDRAPFTAAFSMLPLLDRARAVESLTRRRVRLEAVVRDLAEAPALTAAPGESGSPPHAVRMRLLWLDLAIAELAWLRETVDQVRDGRLDQSGWAPPPDDPGWQMDVDRRRYRELLDR